MPIKVSIVEDDAKTRNYLAALLDGSDHCKCIGTHATAEAAIKYIPNERPRVVLLDLSLPLRSGLDCIPVLKARLPDTEIIVLTVHDDPKLIFQALETGASGYLTKGEPSVKIVDAIAEVDRGGSPMSSAIARLVVRSFRQRSSRGGDALSLTDRQKQILDLVARGQQTKEIASELSLSESTIRTHFRNIYDKLQVHSRAQAMAKYLSH